jgi:hypothetical protein
MSCCYLQVEEAAAASVRYQETIKRLTEGRKGKDQQQGGFRQQERQRELRKFVEREFEGCHAISTARSVNRQLHDRQRPLSRKSQDDTCTL